MSGDTGGAPQLVRAAELVGRPVIATADAAELGTVADVVYDPARMRLVGMRTSGGLFRTAPGEWIPWDRITAIGDDAIMVAGGGAASDAPRPAAEDAPADPVGADRADADWAAADWAAAPGGANIVGLDVLTEDGTHVGDVRDLVVAADGGAVVAYELALDAAQGGGSAFLPGSARIAIGDDAAVIASLDTLVTDMDALAGRSPGTPQRRRRANGEAAAGQRSESTKAELYERARAAGIRGRSSMTKAELAAALDAAGAPQVEQGDTR